MITDYFNFHLKYLEYVNTLSFLKLS